MKIATAFSDVRRHLDRDRDANARERQCRHWWYWVRPNTLMCKHCQSLKINGELYLRELEARR